MASVERITGIGGVFFRSRDPEGLRQWYAEQLGVPDGEPLVAESDASLVWAPFAEDSDHLGSLEQAWMLNYRVRDLDAMLEQLRGCGAPVEAAIQATEQGRFGWATDPEGNRFELWEPAEGW